LRRRRHRRRRFRHARAPRVADTPRAMGAAAAAPSHTPHSYGRSASWPFTCYGAAPRNAIMRKRSDDMTQLEAARHGIITEDMRRVAVRENVGAEFIRDEVALGRLVIPANHRHLAGSAGQTPDA